MQIGSFGVRFRFTKFFCRFLSLFGMLNCIFIERGDEMVQKSLCADDLEMIRVVGFAGEDFAEAEGGPDELVEVVRRRCRRNTARSFIFLL